MLLVLAVFGLAPAVKAQTITVGSGSTTVSTTPIYGLYGYSYSQNLYLGSELTTAGWGGGAGLISKIRFNLSSVPSSPASSNSWTIYLGNTSATTLTAGAANYTPTSAMTMVFSGTVDLTTTGWKEITFSTPFNYDGTNLIVAVDENASGWSGCSWYGTTATGKVRYLYSDTYNPDPNALPGSYSGTSSSSTTRPNVQFEMLPPCTGTPVAGTLPATVPACVGSTATLNATGGSVAAGLAYQWEESADGSTGWVNAAGISTNASYITQPFASAMYYRLVVTCTPSSQSDTSNVAAVVDGSTPPYLVFDGLSHVQSFESWVNGCATADKPTWNWKNTPSTGSNSWRRNDQGSTASW
ncbi:MAG: hypothetical protein KJZ58_12775, partial [Flavobacteriales bacterium]|nr:hypothetical protein [Flavobacteriales bacterium]